MRLRLVALSVLSGDILNTLNRRPEKHATNWSRSWTISTRAWLRMSGMAMLSPQKSKQWGTSAGAPCCAITSSPNAKCDHQKTERFETQPGYQLQHDRCEIEAEVAGQRCKVNRAVNTLRFSRRFRVFAVPKPDTEHTCESLVRAFRYFSGSVKTVLVDHQKAATLKNNNGKVVFNSGFLLLADRYDFLPRASRPRSARTKGEVEQHDYQLYLSINDIDHTKTKAMSPQTNGIGERCHKTILQDFYQVTFRKKSYGERESLQAALDNGLWHDNNERTHQGKMCCGRTPVATLPDGKWVRAEKELNRM
ncbi:integrase catalytic region [Erwinia tracheiphila PSU-1]|nr:integrase catalytic region [Erwinia tracheiphila PSU-1]